MTQAADPFLDDLVLLLQKYEISAAMLVMPLESHFSMIACNMTTEHLTLLGHLLINSVPQPGVSIN